MIKPTVGRSIWYWPHSSETGIRSGNDQPLVAFICHVWNDTTINIAGFDANGVAFNRTSVILKQDDALIPPTVGYASWMPYQVGQAKKDEAPKVTTPVTVSIIDVATASSPVLVPATESDTVATPTVTTTPEVTPTVESPLDLVRPVKPAPKVKSNAALKAALAKLESEYGVTLDEIVTIESTNDTTTGATS